MKPESGKIVEAFNSASGMNGNFMGTIAVSILLLIFTFILSSAIMALVDTYRTRQREGGGNFFSFLFTLIGVIFIIGFFALISNS